MSKIRTPIPFLLDFHRYAMYHDVQPEQTEQGVTPSLGATLDYALLAADLDACKWPDELVERVTLLDPAYAALTKVLVEIGAERERQVGKGYDAAHDDCNPIDLPTLAIGVAIDDNGNMMALDEETEDRIAHIRAKRTSRRQRLIIAAALLVAEIERMDRADDFEDASIPRNALTDAARGSGDEDTDDPDSGPLSPA